MRAKRPYKKKIRDPQSVLEANCVQIPDTGCWLWEGVWTDYGYGRIYLNGKHWLAHRLSWEIYRGPIPNGLFVMHKCDTPACCNPEHLAVGTSADNTKDMMQKGRHWSYTGVYLPKKGPENPRFNRPSTLRGEAQGRAKLTAEKAREIYNDPRKYKTLAEEYGVSSTLIYCVKKGLNWWWATGVENPRGYD